MCTELTQVEREIKASDGNKTTIDAIRRRYQMAKGSRCWMLEDETDLFNAAQYDYDHLFKAGLLTVLLNMCNKKIRRKHGRKNLFAAMMRDFKLPSNTSADPKSYLRRMSKKGTIEVGSDVSMDEVHYAFMLLVHCGQEVLPHRLYKLCVDFWLVYVAITDSRGLAKAEVYIEIK